MIGYFRADEIRAAERATGLLESGTLMARAAHAVADVVVAELKSRRGAVYGSRVGIVAGTGDNGADGLYAGALLARRGVAVTAVSVDERGRIHPAALQALLDAGGQLVESPGDWDLAIDAITGLSGSGPLRERAAKVMESVVSPVISVDVPSGVDADTGVVHSPAVQAEVTVTFGLRRVAHAIAAAQCGVIAVRDIGIEASSPAPIGELTDGDVGAAIPVPGAADDKYTQGVVGVIAGSPRFPGAAVLSTTGAVAATSGMVRYVGPCDRDVVRAHPEVVAVRHLSECGRIDAWVVGPGAGTGKPEIDRMHRVLESRVPVLIDADGLTILAQRPQVVIQRRSPTVLTPHAGEFARLAKAIGMADAADLTDRVASARRVADYFGATVLLKGNTTVIASPGDDPVLINRSVDAEGRPVAWAATAGSGDVLAGILGAYLAAGIAPATAAALAARVHSMSASLAATGTVGGTAAIGAQALAAQIHNASAALRKTAARTPKVTIRLGQARESAPTVRECSPMRRGNPTP